MHEPVELDKEALAFVAQATSDATQPIVLFALEWCEFCWSVRKLFAKLDIPYRAIDLDSVEYQQDDLGGKIRAVLLDQIGSPDHPANLHRRQTHRGRDGPFYELQ